MTTEPRTQHEYGAREIDAARRVLVDLGQVLASWFSDSIVVVGGWVPDLLLPEADEPHIGSIDVDLALDANKLGGGRYAEIVKLLLDTGRYEKTEEPFRLRAKVDLSDGKSAIVVDVDFLKAATKRRRRKGPRVMPDFRPLDADGCAAAFLHPERVSMEGPMISGAESLPGSCSQSTALLPFRRRRRRQTLRQKTGRDGPPRSESTPFIVMLRGRRARSCWHVFDEPTTR